MITYHTSLALSISTSEMINQLFVTLKKSVPAWQEKYINSNAHQNIDNMNDLANYYTNLENQEKKEQGIHEGHNK